MGKARAVCLQCPGQPEGLTQIWGCFPGILAVIRCCQRLKGSGEVIWEEIYQILGEETQLGRGSSREPALRKSPTIPGQLFQLFRDIGWGSDQPGLAEDVPAH